MYLHGVDNDNFTLTPTHMLAAPERRFESHFGRGCMSWAVSAYVLSGVGWELAYRVCGRARPKRRAHRTLCLESGPPWGRHRGIERGLYRYFVFVRLCECVSSAGQTYWNEIWHREFIPLSTIMFLWCDKNWGVWFTNLFFFFFGHPPVLKWISYRYFSLFYCTSD